LICQDNFKTEVELIRNRSNVF